jgi:hypothetical protein
MTASHPNPNKKLDYQDWVKIETCPHRRNHYVLLWLKQHEDWKDFSFWNCPFCGLALDQITGALMQ